MPELDLSRVPGIDLSLLPPPEVVETLEFETLLAARKVRFLDRCPAETRPEIEAVLDLESEPIAILLQESAYLELLLRQRINEAALQCQLASATGSNLDHLAAYYGVTRLIVAPGDPDAIPPVPATYESDTRLRYRAQLAVDGMSTAGPVESYRYHALSADGAVVDAGITSPVPGQVVVTILADTPDGIPDQALLDTVAAALNAKHVRPLTDEVIVRMATIQPYTVEAILTLYPGPSPDVIMTSVQQAVANYTAATHRIGYDVTRSGLFAALHQPGVQNVNLIAPAADIVVPETAAPRCDGVNVTLADTTDV